jgi:lipoate-protein ligase B
MDEERSNPNLLVCPAGTIPYDSAWQWQKSLRERRLGGELPDLLLLLDHPPSYTLGRSTRPGHLAAAEARGISIHRIERGGSITYHGPGQIVGYPIIDLRMRGRDIHRFIRELEEVLIRTLLELRLDARRRSGLTGVWVEDEKIAAIGVHVRHWITIHGFALNVTTELDPFRWIRPCGLDVAVTSVAQLLGESAPGIGETRAIVRRQFEAVFGCRSELVEPELLGLLSDDRGDSIAERGAELEPGGTDTGKLPLSQTAVTFGNFGDQVARTNG